MKRIPLTLIGAAAALLLLAAWTPEVLATVRSTDSTTVAPDARVEYPMDHLCVVTVDPRAVSQSEIAGRANKVTGFVAPDTVEGTLVRLDADWLVLREGRHDNWIPKDKVLMIHVIR
jgi:hypothetical protein